MSTGQILGGSLLLVCGVAILVVGFGVLKARRAHEIFATLFLGIGSLVVAGYVLLH